MKESHGKAGLFWVEGADRCSKEHPKEWRSLENKSGTLLTFLPHWKPGLPGAVTNSLEFLLSVSEPSPLRARRGSTVSPAPLRQRTGRGVQKARSVEGVFLQPAGFLMNNCFGEGFDGFLTKL